MSAMWARWGLCRRSILESGDGGGLGMEDGGWVVGLYGSVWGCGNVDADRREGYTVVQVLQTGYEKNGKARREVDMVEQRSSDAARADAGGVTVAS